MISKITFFIIIVINDNHIIITSTINIKFKVYCKVSSSIRPENVYIFCSLLFKHAEPLYFTRLIFLYADICVHGNKFIFTMANVVLTVITKPWSLHIICYVYCNVNINVFVNYYTIVPTGSGINTHFYEI